MSVIKTMDQHSFWLPVSRWGHGPYWRWFVFIPAVFAAEWSVLCPQWISSFPGSSCPLPLWPGQSETASLPATFSFRPGVFPCTAVSRQNFLTLHPHVENEKRLRFKQVTFRFFWASAASCLAFWRSCDKLSAWQTVLFSPVPSDNVPFSFSTSRRLKEHPL